MSTSSNLSFPPSSTGIERPVVDRVKEQTVAPSQSHNTSTGITNDAFSGGNVTAAGGKAPAAATEQNQAMTTSATSANDSQNPETHLEALDTIITCTALQQTTAGEGQASIAALLRQAKTLLLDNTVTVILVTLRELHQEEDKAPLTPTSAAASRLPEFWTHVRSPKELTIWLQLFDMILYCWGGQGGEAPAFVERYVRYYTEEICRLRQLHDFEEADLLDGGEAAARRIREILTAIKAATKPAHWTLVSTMKKYNRGKLEQPWRILTACMQLSGCLEMQPLASAANAAAKSGAAGDKAADNGKPKEQPQTPRGGRSQPTRSRGRARGRGRKEEESEEPPDSTIVPLEQMKAVLKNLTFVHLERLGDYEALIKNAAAMHQLRTEWLPSPHFDEAKLRDLDLTHMTNPTWHGVPAIAADFVAYLRAVEALSRLHQRLSMRQESTLREAIYARLLTMAAGQLNTVRRHQQWQKLPPGLKEAAMERRQVMTARCSVSGGDDLLSPTSSTASSAATSVSLSFSVDLENSKAISWNVSSVKSPMINIL